MPLNALKTDLPEARRAFSDAAGTEKQAERHEESLAILAE